MKLWVHGKKLTVDGGFHGHNKWIFCNSDGYDFNA